VFKLDVFSNILGSAEAAGSVQEYHDGVKARAAAALDAAASSGRGDAAAACLVLGAACLTAFIQHNLTG
jgi:hypothetical protein